jgi:drug/metabolite transporter (DMT)-like permease
VSTPDDRRATARTETTAPPAQLRMGPSEWLMMGACAFLWGSAYVSNVYAMAEIPHMTLTAGRLLFAILLLWPVALLSGVRFPVDLAAWRPFMVFALLSNIIPYQFVLKGQTGTTAGLAAVLGATAPLFTILLAHYFTSDERITVNKIAGVLVGIAGVAVVMGPEAFKGLTTEVVAKLCLIVASILYAVGGIYAKRLAGFQPLQIATMQMTCGFLIAVPLALWMDHPWKLTMPSATALTAVLLTGVFGSALAAITYFRVFTRAGATNAMLVTLLVPVTPIALGAVLRGEWLSAREILGAAVIALALLIIDGRLVRALFGR